MQLPGYRGETWVILAGQSGGLGGAVASTSVGLPSNAVEDYRSPKTLREIWGRWKRSRRRGVRQTSGAFRAAVTCGLAGDFMCLARQL